MRILVSGTTASMRRFAPANQDFLGHLLTPANGNSVQSLLETGLPWAVDNGAFSGFDAERFSDFLPRLVGQPRLLWVACPDVVSDARATLRLYAEWEPRIKELGLPVAYVLQDGQTLPMLPLGFGTDAVFVGGSDAFKESEHAANLVRAAKHAGKLVHMGRVNSRRRMWHAYKIGCDSVDGSSLSMFGDRWIPVFLRWRRGFDHHPLFEGAT